MATLGCLYRSCTWFSLQRAFYTSCAAILSQKIETKEASAPDTLATAISMMSLLSRTHFGETICRSWLSKRVQYCGRCHFSRTKYSCGTGACCVQPSGKRSISYCPMSTDICPPHASPSTCAHLVPSRHESCRLMPTAPSMEVQLFLWLRSRITMRCLCNDLTLTLVLISVMVSLV